MTCEKEEESGKGVCKNSEIRKGWLKQCVEKRIKTVGCWAVNGCREPAPCCLGQRTYFSNYHSCDDYEKSSRKSPKQMEYEAFLRQVERATDEIMYRSYYSRFKETSKTKKKQKSEQPSSKTQQKAETLNKSAKKKYRSFNTHKKLIPSATVLLLIEKLKKEKDRKNLTLGLSDSKLNIVLKQIDKFSTGPANIKPSEIEEEIYKRLSSEEEEECEEQNQQTSSKVPLQVVKTKVTKEVGVKEKEVEKVFEKEDSALVPKEKVESGESSLPRNLILKELHQLHLENEEIKNKLLEMVEGKQKQTALQLPPQSIDKEDKSNWSLMSSTLQMISKFCDKFSSRKKEKLMEAVKLSEEEEEDEEEQPDEQELCEDPESKQKRYDESYLKFLKTLMEDENTTERNRCQLRK